MHDDDVNDDIIPLGEAIDKATLRKRFRKDELNSYEIDYKEELVSLKKKEKDISISSPLSNFLTSKSSEFAFGSLGLRDRLVTFELQERDARARITGVIRAELASLINSSIENIGAHRLYTILECVFEDLLFADPDIDTQSFVVTADYVREKMAGVIEDHDTSRYIP